MKCMKGMKEIACTDAASSEARARRRGAERVLAFMRFMFFMVNALTRNALRLEACFLI